MDFEFATSLSQVIQNLAITLAVIVGGIWAIYRWFRLREERLSIEYFVEVVQSAKPTDGVSLVSLVFRMKNAGARALKLARDGTEPYTEPIDSRGVGKLWEKVAHRNCELTIWKLDKPSASTNALISLRDETRASKVHLADHPVNLLAESRISPETFWLEPEEVVQSVANLALPAGYYVGQVVTLFDMKPIRKTRKTQYTFDVFSFAFEVLAEGATVSFMEHGSPF